MCLTVTFACGSFSALADQPVEEEDAIYELIDDLETSDDSFDFTSEESKEVLLAESETFPDSFDLRNVDGRCFVTSVKLQSPFATCWGFAAIAAAETSILGSLLYDDPEAYKYLGLSEKQLAYFSHTAINDPNNSQNGEGTYFKGTTSSSIYSEGAPFIATSTFASGIGPHYEVDEFQYKGRNGYTDQAYINGAYHNYCYSAEDDWSIDESLRFKQDYVLSESFLLPAPAQKNSMTGYQIQCSLKKDFSSGKKTVTVGRNSVVKKEIGKLKSNKTYYVRVRTYKTVGKKKYYSGWSKVKRVKTN